MITQESFQNNKKNLYIISSPIGNLGDISLRAIETLKSVAVILAEDTRKTGLLLKHYDIQNKLISYNDITSVSKLNLIEDLFIKYDNIGLISDAGTTLINDPGYELVNYCQNNSINIISVPGASSVIAALSVSGLPSSSFIFLGFFPKKNKEALEILNKYKYLDSTLIFFESPNRIKSTLEILDASPNYQDRKVVLVRELTKLYETIYSGKAKEILNNINDIGEMVLLISPYQVIKLSDEEIINIYNSLIKKGLSNKDAITECSILTNINKNYIYKLILDLNKK